MCHGIFVLASTDGLGFVFHICSKKWPDEHHWVGFPVHGSKNLTGVVVLPSVAPGPATSALPENLEEMKFAGPASD